MVRHEGTVYGGGLTQLGKQIAGSGLVTVLSFSVAAGLAMAIEKTIGFRAATEAEMAGIDEVLHGERGYELVPSAKENHNGHGQLLSPVAFQAEQVLT
jgi:Amt family ammonium transporter